MTFIEKICSSTAHTSELDRHYEQLRIKLALDEYAPYLLEDLVKIDFDEIVNINIDLLDDEQMRDTCQFALEIIHDWWESGKDRRYISHIYAEDIAELDVNERLYLYQELTILASYTFEKIEPPVAA